MPIRETSEPGNLSGQAAATSTVKATSMAIAKQKRFMDTNLNKIHETPTKTY
jgi:hypothetical protein